MGVGSGQEPLLRCWTCDVCPNLVQKWKQGLRTSHFPGGKYNCMFLLGLIAKLIKSQARFPAESTEMIRQHRATEALESHRSLAMCACVLCLLLAQMPRTIYHRANKMFGLSLSRRNPRRGHFSQFSWQVAFKFAHRVLLRLTHPDFSLFCRNQPDLRSHSRQQAEACLKYSCITRDLSKVQLYHVAGRVQPPRNWHWRHPPFKVYGI